MSLWIYPGSFDPATVGHIDVAERASRLCDKLVVAVLNNAAKKATFTVEDRVMMLKKATAHLPNVTVASFGGLLADYAKGLEAHAIVRGLRALSDFEMEFQIASMNRKLAPGIETVFIMTAIEHSFISSSMAKDVGSHGGEISDLIPQANLEFVKNALNRSR